MEWRPCNLVHFLKTSGTLGIHLLFLCQPPFFVLQAITCVALLSFEEENKLSCVKTNIVHFSLGFLLSQRLIHLKLGKAQRWSKVFWDTSYIYGSRLHSLPIWIDFWWLIVTRYDNSVHELNKLCYWVGMCNNLSATCAPMSQKSSESKSCQMITICSQPRFCL